MAGRLRAALSCSPRIVTAIAVAAMSLTLTACACGARAGCRDNSDMREVGDVLRGCNPCRCQERSAWQTYNSIWRGDNPCQCGGSCGNSCGCPSSCAPSCSPPPCGARGVSVAPTDLPPGAKPGEAWCRVYTPAVYETVIDVVTTQCARTQEVWVPPVYKTEIRRVLAEPAHRCELPVDGATRSVETCEVVCPASTTTCTRCVEDACGCPKQVCETVVIPAETCHRLHEVCIEGPSTHLVDTPPLYLSEPCEVELKPGRWVTIEHPPICERVTRRVCKSPESWTWKRNDTCVVPTPPSTPACRPATAPRAAPPPAVLPPVSAPRATPKPAPTPTPAPVK